MTKEKIYHNPVISMDYSDPDAIRVGPDYYMTASSFNLVPGLPILHSRDLVHWELVNYALKAIPFERYDTPQPGCGVWAPAIRYHGGRYWIVFPMPDEGIFVTSTENPEGEWTEPFCIRKAVGWIDPCIFWDDDGKVYLIFAVARSRIGYNNVLQICELDPKTLQVRTEPVKVFEGVQHGQTTVEGPKLYKREGWYYILAPAGGVKTGWQLAMRARNIYGSYEPKVVMAQGNTEINGPHQGALVNDPYGRSWFLHFQDVYCLGRIVHLQPVRWQDGWPVIGSANENSVCGEPVTECVGPKEEKRDGKSSMQALLQYSPMSHYNDLFCRGIPAISWQWNANPKKGWSKVDDQERFFLNAVPVRKDQPIGDYANLFLQKWPDEEFACRITANLSRLAEEELFGVISYGTSYFAACMKRERDDLEIWQATGTQIYGPVYQEQTKEKWQKIHSLPGFFHQETTNENGRDVCLRYLVKTVGTRQIENLPMPDEEVEISLLDRQGWIRIGVFRAEPGRWIGSRMGMFCVAPGEEAAPCTGAAWIRSVKFYPIQSEDSEKGR